MEKGVKFLFESWKNLFTFADVLVRGDAINREPGENPGQTRYCNSYKTHRQNVTVGFSAGKASMGG